MLEVILDRCLEDIRTRRATADECLARFPEHAEQLAPMLKAALALRKMGDIRPSREFKAATRARLLTLGKPAPNLGTRMLQFIVSKRAA